MKKFTVKVLGFEKGTVTATSAHSAMLKGAMRYQGGNTRGVSVIEIN
jgi:hypothetical protein